MNHQGFFFFFFFVKSNRARIGPCGFWLELLIPLSIISEHSWMLYVKKPLVLLSVNLHPWIFLHPRCPVLFQTPVPAGPVPAQPTLWLPLGLQPLPPRGLLSQQLPQTASWLPLPLPVLPQPSAEQPFPAASPFLICAPPRGGRCRWEGSGGANRRDKRHGGWSAGQTLPATLPREPVNGSDWHRGVIGGKGKGGGQSSRHWAGAESGSSRPGSRYWDRPAEPHREERWGEAGPGVRLRPGDHRSERLQLGQRKRARVQHQEGIQPGEPVADSAGWKERQRVATHLLSPPASVTASSEEPGAHHSSAPVPASVTFPLRGCAWKTQGDRDSQNDTQLIHSLLRPPSCQSAPLITLFFSPFLSRRHFPALNCQLPPITPDDTLFQERQLCSLLLKLLFPCLPCKFVTCLQSITLLTCPFWSIRGAQFLGYRLSVSPSCPFRFDLSHQTIAPWFLDLVLRVASSTQTTICCLRPSYDRRQRGGKLQHSKACLDKH